MIEFFEEETGMDVQDLVNDEEMKNVIDFHSLQQATDQNPEYYQADILTKPHVTKASSSTAMVESSKVPRSAFITSSKLIPKKCKYITLNARGIQISNRFLLPDILASNYANFFVFSLNQQETTELRRFFHTICTPEARIVTNVFSLPNDSHSGNNMPLNHFGNFSYADLSIEEFIYLQSTCWEVVPDGFANIFSSRSCYEGKSSVYISCYCFTGTIISKDSVIGLGDGGGSLCQLRHLRSDILQMSVLQHYRHSYKAEGSLIMYLNREGKVTSLEFYYRFLF